MHFSKKFIRSVFENPQLSYFSYVNDILGLATIVSIFAVVLETVPSLSVHHTTFLIIEWVTVAFFSAEYILRLWSSQNRRGYAFSFFGVVDLIAIIPTIVGLGNFTYLKSARIVRVIRFLRIVRLSKLSRIKVKDAEETLGIFGFNILLYAATLIFVMLVLGVSLHVLGTTDEKYWSIPEGMFWTFSVFLGGLPAVIPEGTFGTTIFIIAKFCGMALFGLLVGVVGKIFNGMILGKK